MRVQLCILGHGVICKWSIKEYTNLLTHYCVCMIDVLNNVYDSAVEPVISSDFQVARQSWLNVKQ